MRPRCMRWSSHESIHDARGLDHVEQFLLTSPALLEPVARMLVVGEGDHEHGLVGIDTVLRRRCQYNQVVTSDVCPRCSF